MLAQAWLRHKPRGSINEDLIVDYVCIATSDFESEQSNITSSDLSMTFRRSESRNITEHGPGPMQR